MLGSCFCYRFAEDQEQGFSCEIAAHNCHYLFCSSRDNTLLNDVFYFCFYVRFTTFHGLRKSFLFCKNVMWLYFRIYDISESSDEKSEESDKESDKDDDSK